MGLLEMTEFTPGLGTAPVTADTMFELVTVEILVSHCFKQKKADRRGMKPTYWAGAPRRFC